MTRDRSSKAFVLSALRRAAHEADRRADMFAHHRRNRRSEMSAHLWRISQESAEAALRLWAMAAEVKRS